ncbi:MAG: DNA/RNA nuclease SfsA [Rhodospirillaceae bacterium]|nr:DNA/RNA nuclease SfsA [Rhodospirillaceae bacterium]
MKFETPLVSGKLIKRYKRFLADIELDDGKIITAHCANSGSMLSLNIPGAKVWLTPNDDPKRKLKYTWEIIEIGKARVGINTQHPNRIVAEAIEDGIISELTGYENLKREVKYGENSRIDILLSSPNKPDCYVEVKNVTMKRGKNKNDPAEFPDAVTTRGAKHLVELANMVKNKKRAVMFYLVQRTDCKSFTLASDIDPVYAKEFAKARKAGVEIIAYNCQITPKKISISGPCDINGL